MKLKYFYRYIFVFMVSLFVLTGCGSSSGGDEPVVSDKVGYLIDSPIANIDYECGTKKAKTNNEGKFECSQLPVTFRVGNIEVGTLDALTADGKVYPQDLAGVGRDNFTEDNVIKIAVFLQSLDDDGNIDTAIKLPNEINSTKSDTLGEMTLDDVTVFLTSIGKTPVTKEDAVNHLKEQFNMDVTKPMITLNGASIITLTKGTAYTELGATATDDRDGNITVTTSGTVDINTVGSYTITYKAKDSAGNEATATRTVNVVLPPDTTKPVITLNGENNITLTQGTAYTELGATATDDRDGTVTVTTSGTVDINTVGSYTITYKAKDSAGNEAVATRTVNVLLPPDTTKPVITLNGENPVELTQGTAYSEAGATATDDRDGTVTVTKSGSVDVNTVGSYTITYKAKDSAGNEAVVTRTVNVVLPPDMTKPVITLNGENPMELTQGTAYTELGATATDDRDGTVTVTTSGTVDINTVGTYTLSYTAKDSAGNEATATRTVNVVSNETNVNKVYQKSFSYDSTNRVIKEDLGNGNYIEYVYDDSGNLISQTVVK